MRVLFQFETLFMFSTQYKKFRNYVNFLSSWFPTTPRISLMTYIYCVYFIFNFKIEILKLTWSVEKSELQNGEIGKNSLSLSSTTKLTLPSEKTEIYSIISSRHYLLIKEVNKNPKQRITHSHPSAVVFLVSLSPETWGWIIFFLENKLIELFSLYLHL